MTIFLLLLLSVQLTGKHPKWKLFLNKDGYNGNNLFPKNMNEGAFPEAMKQTTFMYTTFDTSIWCIEVNAMQ